MENVKVVDFYNEYLDRQIKAGIHHRHLSIQRWVEKFGLRSDSKVLEVGCGIGTQTQLLLQFLSASGSVTAIDISDESIDYAKKRLTKYSNLNLIAGDIIDVDVEEMYDVIVLPDVIEHIPLERHERLFEKLSKVLKVDGFILIHIPDPQYLEWIHENNPEDLQVIDQPIHTDRLLSNVYKHGLIVHYLESYSVFNQEEDYQVIVLKRRQVKEYMSLKDPINDSLTRRIKRKFKLLYRKK